MTPSLLRLSRHADALLVCRLPPTTPLAEWMLGGPLASLTRTARELSVVVTADRVPDAVQREGPFTAFVVEGPLDFALTGIVARLVTPLAAAGIPVFVVSTYDTDYVLVRTHLASEAVAAWARTEGVEIT